MIVYEHDFYPKTKIFRHFHMYCGTQDQGLWNMSTVVFALLTSYDAMNLLITKDYNIHILYSFYLLYGPNPNNSFYFVHTTNESGIFRTETIDNNAGDQISSILDQNEKIHTTYYKWNFQELYYSTNESGTWETNLIYTYP